MEARTSGDDAITISFNMTREVRSHLMQQAVLRMVPGFWIAVALCALLISFGGYWLLSISIMAGSPPHYPWVISSSLGALLIFWYWYAMKRSTRAGNLPDQQTFLRITSAGIEMTTNAIDSRIAWEAFSDYFETKDYFLLNYRKQGPVHMVEPIPKSALSTPETAQALRVLLSQKLPVAPTRRYGRRTWLIVGMALIPLTALWILRPRLEPPKEASIEEFIRERARDNIVEVWIVEDALLVRLFDPVDGSRRFRVVLPKEILTNREELDRLLEGIPRDRVRFLLQ